MSTSRELKGFTTGDLLVDSFILDSCRRWGVDPLLIYSQMHQESTFKSRALSPKGASGLMQLMPGTARRFGVEKIWDAKQNIEGGVHYMRWLLDTFNGDVILALAGYNAGEGAVMKYGWQVPPLPRNTGICSPNNRPIQCHIGWPLHPDRTEHQWQS
jgi:hypothetical protein